MNKFLAEYYMTSLGSLLEDLRKDLRDTEFPENITEEQDPKKYHTIKAYHHLLRAYVHAMELNEFFNKPTN